MSEKVVDDGIGGVVIIDLEEAKDSGTSTRSMSIKEGLVEIAITTSVYDMSIEIVNTSVTRLQKGHSLLLSITLTRLTGR